MPGDSSLTFGETSSSFDSLGSRQRRSVSKGFGGFAGRFGRWMLRCKLKGFGGDSNGLFTRGGGGGITRALAIIPVILACDVIRHEALVVIN